MNLNESFAVWQNERVSYSFFKTRDASTSISIQDPNSTFTTELMHSVQGAFTETVYLYEPVVEYALQNNLKLEFLSIGLGAGYIEVMVCAYILKHAPQLLSQIKIYSFEKEPELRDFFCAYFFDKEIPTHFHACYNDVLQLNAKNYGLDTTVLKKHVQELLENKNIQMEPDFSLSTPLPTPVSGVFFDAFSANTSPELWTDALLEHVFRLCAPTASFATYAARASLKNKMKEHHFVFHKKIGFGGKKESTFGKRSQTN